MIKETLYNAFTKIGTLEKKRIINFLYRNIENTNVSEADVIRGVEYAVKEIASFGGYVLVLEDETQLLGVAVINHTGMEGNSPKSVLVQIATSNNYEDGNLLKQLVDRVIHHCDGELGLQILPDNPAIAHFENFGFKQEFVVMTLRRPTRQAKIYRRYRVTG
ncbi:MAG: hypothetical protein AAFO94_11585 [Bacteroidota bacterium]